MLSLTFTAHPRRRTNRAVPSAIFQDIGVFVMQARGQRKSEGSAFGLGPLFSALPSPGPEV